LGSPQAGKRELPERHLICIIILPPGHIILKKV
jgi:hypothetical protein